LLRFLALRSRREGSLKRHVGYALARFAGSTCSPDGIRDQPRRLQRRRIARTGAVRRERTDENGYDGNDGSHFKQDLLQVPAEPGDQMKGWRTMRNRFAVLLGAAVVSLAAATAAATLQTFVGTITDPDGVPIQGIEVSFFDATNAELIATATTDPNGDYDSGAIPTGDYRVRFADPFGAQFYGDGGIEEFCDGTIVPLPASTTTILDVQLPPREPRAIAAFEGPIAGTVVDRATGAPLQGIRVSILKNFNAEVMATLITDADGVYSFGSKGELLTLMRIRFSDPTNTFFSGFYGAGSDTFCTAPTVSEASASLDGFLDRVPPEQLTQLLADTVQSYDLPASVATMLGTPLTQARRLLADGGQGNTAAACGQLASFLTRVDVQERRGELSAAEAGELRALAVNLQGVLGCQ
jgi:5-hydroxyisourate hydrolase-like protein (transthyretin family)